MRKSFTKISIQPNLTGICDSHNNSMDKIYSIAVVTIIPQKSITPKFIPNL